MEIRREEFGALPDGTAVERITLRHASGFEARLLTYGATLQALLAPGRDGPADVVLGHDGLEGYLARRDFFGATIGRVANRIAGGRFVLDGQAVAIAPNDGPHALHGGDQGFDRQNWEVAELAARPYPCLVLRRLSPDGEGGFPGALETRVTYALTGPAELTLRFSARTTRPTVVNLTHHGFFNLAGGGTVLGHRLWIGAAHYLPVDATLIPLGGPAPVAGTPFDFRAPRRIEDQLRAPHPQLLRARGYDHTFCLDHRDGALRPAARLEEAAAGRAMTLLTDQPGLQFYSGNFLDGTVAGKGGVPIRQSDALCLEPQGWPDAPNRPDYPGIRLDPAAVYRHHTVLRFEALP